MKNHKLYSYFALVAILSMSLFTIAQASNRPLAPVSNQSSAATITRVSQAEAARKINPELLAMMTSDDARVSTLIYLSEQANVNNNISPLNWAAKGQYVYDQLTNTANRTQPALLAEVNSLKSANKVTTVKQFWISNMIVVDGTAAAIRQLAERSDIGSIRLNGRHFAADEVVENKAAANEPATVGYGITQLKVDQVWAAGDKGAGIVVGSLDSGVNGSHVALAPQYRGAVTGTMAGADYNWKNVVPGGNANVPTDYDTSSNHGTHTTGTMIGDDGSGNQIGVAPEAQWIACDAIADGTSDQDLINCFQWFIAPTHVDGTLPRPDLRPRLSTIRGTPPLSPVVTFS